MTYKMTVTLPNWRALELDCTLADGSMTIEGAGLDLCYALGRSTVTVDGADAVNKETLDMALQLTNSQRDNAILTAELNTEKKMVEVYNALNDKINRLNTEQAAINSAQSVTNCAVTSQLAVAQTNINTLMGLTKTVIPNSNVCPGWGTATVSVETSTTTT